MITAVLGLDPSAGALPVPAPSRAAALREALPAVAAALAFRGACYVAMTAAAIWNELRPAPTLPDLVLAHVPYVEGVARGNYLLWLLLYCPSRRACSGVPAPFVRYAVTGGARLARARRDHR